jgi:hypothetical protein
MNSAIDPELCLCHWIGCRTAEGVGIAAAVLLYPVDTIRNRMLSERTTELVRFPVAAPLCF